MGHILSEFLKTDMYEKLALRGPTMGAIVEHLESLEGVAQIVETGTARVKDNFGGDGQSALVWDWVIERKPNLSALSIDIDPKAIEVAQAQTTHICYQCEDSIAALQKFPHPEQIKLLYLDSYDWDPYNAVPSMFHHLCELATVWAKLPSGCMIVVDDRHTPMDGKHVMVEHFLRKQKIEPIFAAYQIGWIKP